MLPATPMSETATNESGWTCWVAAKVAEASAPPKSITISEGMGMHAEDRAIRRNTAR